MHAYSVAHLAGKLVRKENQPSLVKELLIEERDEFCVEIAAMDSAMIYR